MRAPFFAAVFFDLAEIFLAAMTPSSFLLGRCHHDDRLTALEPGNRRAESLERDPNRGKLLACSL